MTPDIPPLEDSPFQRAHRLEAASRLELPRDTRQDRLRAIWRDVPFVELCEDLVLLATLIGERERAG